MRVTHHKAPDATTSLPFAKTYIPRAGDVYVPTELLYDRDIVRAKPEAKDVAMKDGGGLFLLVKTTGEKWWRYRYTLNGKETWAIALRTGWISSEMPRSDARSRAHQFR